LPTSKRLRLHCSALNAASLGRAGLALLAGFSFASASAARAADAAPTEQGTGFYATLGLGASEAEEVHANKKSNFIYNNQQYEFNPSLILHPSPGFSAEAGLGYDFGLVRTELTYLYNNTSFNDSTRQTYVRNTSNNNSIVFDRKIKFNGSADSNSLLLSAYLDIPTGSRFVPYIGGGIGPSQVNVSGFPRKQDSYNLLGYQAKLGVSYLASCSTDLFVEGTYKGSSASNLDHVDYSGMNNWGARLGARLRFANRCASSSLAK